MKKYLLECCVDSVESAVCAAQGGADRLELCANLIIGGTTPTPALYEKIRESVEIPVHVLIRPRFGDFLYSPEEADLICREIAAFSRAGADGVVIGSLLPDGSLNTEQMKRFLDRAQGMSVTLHRAFDMCRDPFAALEQAQRLGVNTILTSGQAASCLEGISLLKQLSAAKDAPVIMAGGGIGADAVRTLLSETGLRAFHMSGKTVLDSGMAYRNPAVSMGLPGMSEYQIWRTDPEAVRSVRSLLDEADA